MCDLPDGSCYDKVRAVMLLMVAVAPAGGVSAGPSCLVPPNWEGWPAGWTDVFMRGMASLATGNYSLGISRNSRFPTSFSIRWLFFVLPRGCDGLLLSLMVDETLSVRCWPGPAGEKLVCALLVWLLMAWAGAIWVHLILDTSVPHRYLTRYSSVTFCLPWCPLASGFCLGGPHVTQDWVLGGFREKDH